MSIPSITHHFIRPQGYSQAHHSHSVPYFGAQDPLQRSAFQDCWEAQPGLLNMDPTKTGQSLRSIVYNNSISCNHVCITYDSYDVCIYIYTYNVAILLFNEHIKTWRCQPSESTTFRKSMGILQQKKTHPPDQIIGST